MNPKTRPLRIPPSPPAQSGVAQQLSQVFFELVMRQRLQFNEEVAALGISPIQARTLLCIDAGQPRTMSEVAQALGCGPSNITGVIDKLEARGLVERRMRAGDRRARTLAMTRKGLSLRKRLADRLAEPAPWMLAISPGDQERLVEILRRALDRAPPG